MSASVEDLVRQSNAHRASNRLPEALASAIAATRADSTDPNAWWHVALSRLDLGQYEHAKTALLEVVNLAPWFADGWVELGKIELADGDDDDAIYSFNRALEYEDDHVDALINLANVYGGRGADHEDVAREVAILERIASMNRVSSGQLNRLGCLHYAEKRFFDAIESWKEASATAPDPAFYFNLGLAYSSADVGQLTDAIDSFRRAIECKPDYEIARTQINRLLPDVLSRADACRGIGQSILPEHAWYATYLNPYQLLNIADTEEDPLEDLLVPKTLQRLRKRVLQEIELEEGVLSWMPGLRLDRSRAIAAIDELNNGELALYHFFVYQDSKLLNFLTTGAHAHFLVDAEESPLQTLQHLDSDPNFLEWLGGYFAAQFDAVLTKAISGSEVELITQLASGRRWVSPNQDDACFQASRRAAGRLLIPIRELAAQAEDRLIKGAEVQRLLSAGRLAECLNALPVQFRDIQSEAVVSLRSIALACHNEHSDPEEAQRVLKNAESLRFKSAELKHLVQEDLKTLAEMVERLKEHEFRFTPRGQPSWAITRKGVTKGSEHSAPDDVNGVRWGTTLSRVPNGLQVEQEIAFWVAPGREIRFYLRDARTSTAETGTELRFRKMVGAALHYIVPSLVERLLQYIRSGKTLKVGPCNFTSEGVAYVTRRFIFSKDNFVPWRDMCTSLSNGQVHIASKRGAANPIAVDLRAHYNASMIPLLKAAITGEK